MRYHPVILAAGFSSRFGDQKENKLLADLDGKPMYRHITDRLLAIKEARDDIDDLTVITRKGEIFDICRADKRLFCVENPHPERGISSSMKIGLTTVGCLIATEFREAVRRYGDDGHSLLNDSHVMVCFVADEPYLQEETIHAFLDGFKESGKMMAAISLDGTPYNPCAFRDDCWRELKDLSGDTGGKQLIRRHADDVYYYPLPVSRAREVSDIDFKEDLS